MRTLGILCVTTILSGCSQEPKIDVSEHYADAVAASQSVDIFIKNENETYDRIATLSPNTVVALASREQQNMEEPYFQLLDSDYYIDANMVMPSVEQVKPSDVIPFVPYNENIQTNSSYRLYDEASQEIASVMVATSYPIYIKEEQRYGINLDGHLFYVDKNDVESVVPTMNSDAEVAKEVPVLMYHAFYDASNPPEKLDGNYVEKETFRSQLQYLKENSFTTLRMQDLEKFLDGKTQLPRKSVAITMDDGYESEALIAAPLLHEYGFYGTAFLITSWYGSGELPQFWKDAPSLGLEMQSHSNGMHAGGCSEQHGGKILCVDQDEGVNDIKTSMNITGGNVFCYPFGDFNDHAKNILKLAGIHMAFTVQNGTVEPGMDKLELPRIRIHGEGSLKSFAAGINY